MKNPVFDDVITESTNEGISEFTLTAGEVLLGTLVGFAEDGKPLVAHPLLTNTKPVAAISTQALNHQHIGRQIALMFANQSVDQPIIMGIIHSPLYSLLDNLAVADLSTQNNTADTDSVVFESPLADRNTQANSDEILRVDGKRVLIEGQEEITLTCGAASITLTKAGKILIRGTYLQSRSSGVNRILGGSVQVN
jgi:hypothetical protein